MDSLSIQGRSRPGVFPVENSLARLPRSSRVVIAVVNPARSGIDAALVVLPVPINPDQINLGSDVESAGYLRAVAGAPNRRRVISKDCHVIIHSVGARRTRRQNQVRAIGHSCAVDAEVAPATAQSN